MSYTKLASSILTSTIWMEDDHTRLVWFTMLAMADKNGEVQGSIPGLANVARVPIESCRAAIERFTSPDRDSRTTDDEGRRIEKIEGGWHLLNHAKYRDLLSGEDRRRKAAERQQRVRDRAKRRIADGPSHKSVTTCDKSHQNCQADTDTDTEKSSHQDSHTHGRDARETNQQTPTRPVEPCQSGPSPAFREFATIYPRWSGEVNAWKAWQAEVWRLVSQQGISDADAEEAIIHGAKRFRDSQAGQSPSTPHDADYRKSPEKWLSGGHFSDSDAELAKPNRKGEARSGGARRPRVAPPPKAAASNTGDMLLDNMIASGVTR